MMYGVTHVISLCSTCIIMSLFQMILVFVNSVEYQYISPIIVDHITKTGRNELISIV